MPTKRVKRPSKRRHSPPVSRPGALRGLRIEVFEGAIDLHKVRSARQLAPHASSAPKWYVRLRWPNGRIFSTSEAYSSRAKALEMARRAALVGIAPGVTERLGKAKR